MENRKLDQRFAFCVAWTLTACIVPSYLSVAGQAPPDLSKIAKPTGILKSADVAKEPDLPHLPKYSGKYCKFLGGASSEGITRGTSYHLRYETAETPQQVIDWYEGALKTYGYRITYKKPTRLTAFHPENGSAVLLLIAGAAQPGFDPQYQCHFTINYSEQPPEQPPEKPSDKRPSKERGASGAPSTQPSGHN